MRIYRRCVCGWVPVGEYAARSSFAVARGSLHAVCRDEIPFRRGANRLVCFGCKELHAEAP